VRAQHRVVVLGKGRVVYHCSVWVLYAKSFVFVLVKVDATVGKLAEGSLSLQLYQTKTLVPFFKFIAEKVH
jgi:hypothetical protein